MAPSGIPLTAAAIASPRFVVLKPTIAENSYVSYKDGRLVIDKEEGVYSPFVKIEVESARKIEAGKTFVHLRFCHSNRYIGGREGSEVAVAESKQPDEDMKKKSSTLFEFCSLFDKPHHYYFCHVQSQASLIVNEAGDALLLQSMLDIRFGVIHSLANTFFELVDWDSLVKLPKSVAFKGDNGRYLKGYWLEDHQYLQFASSDPYSDSTGHEVELLKNGYVKIKCLHFSGRYWRNCVNWIWADSWDSSTTDESLLFWPVKVDENTIALRSAMNNNFCARLTTEGKENCLDAASPTIDAQARLVVQELVAERKISNVRYRMEDARIFNEKPFIAGTTSGVNESDRESTVSVTVGCTTTSSYSFSRTTSLTAGVTATIEADVLEIVKASVQFSFQISESFEWGKSKSIEKSVSATGTVTVPPRTRAIVNYVGTMGTCEVPYSYRRQDKSSTDGKIVFTDEIDGIYTGVNAYNFSFQVQKYEPL